MKVLIIESDEHISRRVSASLVGNGHEIYGPVSRLDDAVYLSEVLRPDLVFLNPIGHAEDVVEAVGQFSSRMIPVIFITKNGNEISFTPGKLGAEFCYDLLHECGIISYLI